MSDAGASPAGDRVIVVGVDGSRHGADALEWGLAEARLRDARVRVVHAWSIVPRALRGVLPPGLERARAGAVVEAEDVLRRALEDADGEGVHVEPTVVEGQTAAVLVKAATDADLLVVGSRGHRGVAGVLLGSVSQQCLHHAPCPIAVVHASHHGDRRRIVVGVDGSPGADAALDWAADEARRRETSLLAVCAYHEAPGVSGGGPAAAGALAGLRESLATAAEDVLEHAERAVDEVGVSTLAVHGHPAEALLTAAGDAELLVVGSRGRGGFASLVLGSVSQHCAARAPGVVVVVPSGSRPRD